MYLTFLKNNTRIVPTEQDYNINDLFNGIEFNEQQFIEDQPGIEYQTKTVITAVPPRSHNVQAQTAILQKLLALTRNHHPTTLESEYTTFYIPKHNGGLREINAPTEQLMQDLREMKNIFQYELKVLYHNTAYAYVPTRNILKALQVHQKNNSRWFLKLDIKDFFPSCNQDFVVKQLRQIYPFCMWSEEIIKSFIWVCFRDNELPQGTPMSPMLTNLIMIPFDYAMQQYAYDNHLTYTRYADDILISSYNDFNWQQVQAGVNLIFQNLRMPFTIKTEKTRYGSSAGRNWNLGLMYNKDNRITVGYRNKKKYKAMLNNLFKDITEHNEWTKDELYYFQGITSYYTSVEPEYFNTLIKKYEEKYNLNLKQIYKELL